MEPGEFGVFSTDDAGVPVLLDVELVIDGILLSIFFPVWLKVQFDDELVFSLTHKSGQAFDQVPVGLLHLGVAQDVSFWIKDLSVLIDGFLASV